MIGGGGKEFPLPTAAPPMAALAAAALLVAALPIRELAPDAEFRFKTLLFKDL